MVRIYLPPRFSKRRMNEKIAQQALTMFGGPALFQKTKVVHSMACYMNRDEHLFSINIQAGAPYCP